MTQNLIENIVDEFIARSEEAGVSPKEFTDAVIKLAVSVLQPLTSKESPSVEVTVMTSVSKCTLTLTVEDLVEKVTVNETSGTKPVNE